VYRGCADPRNLPLGVDSSLQCREQGLLPAVWWFCNGTLCNSQQFGTVCGGGADSSGGNSGLSFDGYFFTTQLAFVAALRRGDPPPTPEPNGRHHSVLALPSVVQEQRPVSVP